jgi:predicted DNA repair protein MutK
MASSFFALLDDIASVLDDVAVLSKVAAKKTSGVLGDDLALNANQVSGVAAKRELPVVWAVAKGSLLNKAIIVPMALLLSWLAPWLIPILLILGGLYLAYEGAEKIVHYFQHRNEVHRAEDLLNIVQTIAPEQLIQMEKEKIKGAIRTDFILSAEIIIISLGTVADKSLLTQSLVLIGISLLMTVGVYGFVALIVKLDDLGIYFLRKKILQLLGKFLIQSAPILMKFLSIAGTIAMFLVGGGILVHQISWIHHIADTYLKIKDNEMLNLLITSIFEGVIGLMAGLLLIFITFYYSKLRKIK